MVGCGLLVVAKVEVGVNGRRPGAKWITSSRSRFPSLGRAKSREKTYIGLVFCVEKELKNGGGPRVRFRRVSWWSRSTDQQR